MVLKLKLFYDSFSLSPDRLSLLWGTLTISVRWLEMGGFWISLSAEPKSINPTLFLGKLCRIGFFDIQDQLDILNE